MHQVDNPETFRQNVRDKITRIIIDDPDTIANLEKAVFNYAIKEATSKKILKKWDNPFFVQLYIDRLRTIFINLKKDADLLNQLKNKEITPQSIVFMTHQEMNPGHWKNMIEKKIKRDANKFNNNTQASTDTFTCRKCKSKKCTYYELQTRSADEPATIFITCLNCSHNFRS